MTAPTLAVQSISVDGWTAYDYPDPPVDPWGNVWVWQDVTGWYGGLSPRGASVPRPMMDGEYDGQAPFGGRQMEFSGQVLADTREGLQKGLDRLANVLAGPTRRGNLVVTEGVIPLTRQMMVRLGGPTLLKRTSTLMADWSISLYAPDPTRYSNIWKTANASPGVDSVGRVYDLTFPRVYGEVGNTGRASCYNAGNTNTFPVFLIDGQVYGPRLTLAGADGYFLQMGDRGSHIFNVPAGSRLNINTYSRTILLNGANRRYDLSADSRWFSLPPGPSDIVYTAIAGQGPLTVMYRDAWS